MGLAVPIELVGIFISLYTLAVIGVTLGIVNTYMITRNKNNNE